jgi:hypothetical protein
MLKIQGPPNTEKKTQETKNTGISHYMRSQFMQISYKVISLQKTIVMMWEVIVIMQCMNRSETHSLCTAYH